MATVYLQDTTLKSIGNAIREKTGSEALLLPGDMANAIAGISGGGSGGGDFPGLPNANTRIWQASTPSATQYLDIPSDIDPAKIQMIALTANPSSSSAAPDYYSCFVYIKGWCKYWKDSGDWHNFGLISVGASSTGKYGYSGFSFDSLGTGTYQELCMEESTSYPQAWCYLTIGAGQCGGCAMWDGPVEEGHEFTNAEVNFGTVITRRGGFYILYEK